MMHSNRQPELYAAALVPYAAAAVALVLRMVARRKTRLALLWEDYLAVVAFVSMKSIL
jgi:7-keto-8-aminopelargonate synthetase-like enzyme